ncbi:hypothetical protein ACJJTC_006400 [Scirpophaga incertulas]
MAALVFDKCCGCIELRTGCLIIGYLNLIASIILAIVTTLVLIGTGVIVANADEIQVEGHPEITSQQISTMAVVLSVILLIVMLLFLTFNIVFLVGVHKDKRGHVRVYLGYMMFFIVVNIVLFFAGFAGPVAAGDIVRSLLMILLNIYFFLVIRSYYLKMGDRSRQPAIYNTA